MKGKKWVRLYTKVPHDIKIQRLSDGDFRFWVNCLCLAGENDGVCGTLDEIAWKLRIPKSVAERRFLVLEAANLQNRTPIHQIVMHDWHEHQYESDSSTERVRAFRTKEKVAKGNVSRNVSETLDETDQSRAEQSRNVSSSTDKASSIEQASNSAKNSPRSPARLPARETETRPNGKHTDWLDGVVAKASQGISLPPLYVENEYGRRERNPASVAIGNAIENARERIRNARRPVAYARSLILKELKGA